VLGHQLSDDPPEGAVPLPLPAPGRVVPEDHPVAHRLDTDRRGIPMAARGRVDRPEHPRPAQRPTVGDHQRPRPSDEGQADPEALRRPRHAAVVLPSADTERQPLHRGGLQHRQARSGIPGAVLG